MTARYLLLFAILIVCTTTQITQAIPPEKAQELAQEISDFIEIKRDAAEKSNTRAVYSPQDLHHIQRLIEEGADINACIKQFALWRIDPCLTLFHQALCTGDRALVDFFLEHGALIPITWRRAFNYALRNLANVFSNQYDILRGIPNDFWEIITDLAEFGVYEANLSDDAAYTKRLLSPLQAAIIKQRRKEVKGEPGFFDRFTDAPFSTLMRTPEAPNTEIERLISQETSNWELLINALRVAAGEGQVDTVKLILARLQLLNKEGKITNRLRYEQELLKALKILNILSSLEYSNETVSSPLTPHYSQVSVLTPRNVFVYLKGMLLSFIADYYRHVWHISLRALTINGSLPEDIAVHILQQNYPDLMHELITEIVHEFYEYDVPQYQARAQTERGAPLIEELFNMAQVDVDAFIYIFKNQASHLSEQNLENLRNSLERLRQPEGAISAAARSRVNQLLPMVYDELQRRRIQPIKQSLDEQLDRAIRDGDVLEVRELLGHIRKISPALLEIAHAALRREEEGPHTSQFSPELVEARQEILRLIQNRLMSVTRPLKRTFSETSM